MSSRNSKKGSGKPLEAPQYFSMEDLHEAVRTTGSDHFIGDIWHLMVPSRIVGEPAHMTWVLKIAEGASVEDCYRWYDDRDEAVGQRVLRGLEPSNKIKSKFLTGAKILNPQQHAVARIKSV